jgi:hypothetical protein
VFDHALEEKYLSETSRLCSRIFTGLRLLQEQSSFAEAKKIMAMTPPLRDHRPK